MSRSNPTDNAVNPAVRWHEWNGELGTVRYYDKTEKKTVDLGTEFSFILLDQLATVGGWHEASSSGIYSNEVRDTRQDVMVVKAFKGGTLAEGLYKAIKDRVNVAGGGFVANCYIAFKQNEALFIGSIKFKGAALSAWMDFSKAHRGELYKKAIQITGYTEGKKGRVVFRVPVFGLKDISDATNHIAVALDLELQAFLKSYLARTKSAQVETQAAHAADERETFRDEELDNTPDDPAFTPSLDDIPFSLLLPLLLAASWMVA